MKYLTKKLLAVLLLILPFITNAQLAEQWNIAHNFNALKQSRGIAYNITNNHLYATYIEGTYTYGNEADSNKIIVLDASTGDSIKSLTLAGLALNDNGYGLRDVEVSDDGGIFATITTTNNFNPIKLYYWSDEDAQPIELWEDASGVDTDHGPGFNVNGDFSTEALIILPHQDVNSVFYFEVDNGVLGSVNTLTLTGVTGGTGVHIQALGTRIADGFWYSNSATTPTFIDGTGNIVGSINPTLFTGTTGDVKQFTAGANTYICVSDGGTFHVIDITSANADFSNITATEFIETIAGTASVTPGWPSEYGDGQEQAVFGSTDGTYAVYSLSGGNYIKMLAPDAAPIATNIKVVGNPQEGQLLSASYFYIDFNNDPEGSSTFRWLNSDTPEGTYTEIAGATALSYTLAATDANKFVKFEVTPVASSGSPLTGIAVLSSPSLQIVAVTEEYPVASDVAFSGTLTSGQLLTATYTYSDSDGDLEGESTYKWFTADDAIGTNALEIVGASATTYTLTESEVDKHIAFEVTPIAASGSLLVGNPVLSSYSVDPVLTAPVAPVANDVTISGTEEVGMVLTGAYTYFDANNDPEGSTTFQWYTADDAIGTNQAVIAGAVEMTYMLIASEEGKFIFFGVIPVQEDGTPGTEAFAVTVGAIAPYIDEAPVADNVVLSGTPESGVLLSATYDYSDYNNDPEGASIYQWYTADDASGTNQALIAGAGNKTYLVTDADLGKHFAFEVTPVAMSGTTTTGTAVLSNYTSAAGIASTNSFGLERMWIGSTRMAALPWYLGTGSTERGLAVGSDHIYIASRNGGTRVMMIDKADGSYVGELSTEGMTGTNLFEINDVEVSDDGQILAAPLMDGTSFFIYKWENEAADPVKWIEVTYADGMRLGDKFTVTGDVSGDAVIFAAASGSMSGNVLKWVVTAGVPGDVEFITLVDFPADISVVAVQPTSLEAGANILVDAKGIAPSLYTHDGTFIESFPMVDDYATYKIQSNSPNLFNYKGRTMAAFFQAMRQDPLGSRVIVLDITSSPVQIVDSSEYVSDLMPWNGYLGELDITVDGDYYHAFMMQTNNGIARFRGEMLLPEFVSAETSLDGLAIMADFTKSIDDASLAGNDTWTVLAGGTEIAVTGITSVDETISFVLASAIAEGDAVTITYDGLGTVASFDGMPLAAFGPSDVLNLVNASVPEAQSVTVTGGLNYTDIATGSYTFFDANDDLEGVSTYKWYKADDDAGTNQLSIIGEVTTSLTITADLEDKFIAFEVTPVALTGGDDFLVGVPVISSWAGPITNVGIDNVWGNNIVLYPNPVTDNLFIKNANEVYRVVVTNILGEEILSIENNMSSDIKINTQKFKSGIYMITLFNNQEFAITSKFLKIN